MGKPDAGDHRQRVERRFHVPHAKVLDAYAISEVRRSTAYRDLIACGYEDEIASYQGRPVEGGTDVLITFVRRPGAETDPNA